MSIFKSPLGEFIDYQDIVTSIKKKEGPIQISDMADTPKAHLVAELLKEEKPWRLVVTYDETRAREIYEDLLVFGKNVWLYPAKDLLFFSADIQGNLITRERVSVWQHLLTDESGIVVTTVDGLMDKLEGYQTFREEVLTIRSDDKIDVEQLSKKLVDLGYERVTQVEAPGQFGIRGGIVDIYSMTWDVPVRIELWDEDIDAMKTFDPESQRSQDAVEELNIYPAKERETAVEESFLCYFCKEKTLIFVDEPMRVKEKAEVVEKEFQEGMSGRIEAGQIKREDVVDLFGAKEILERLSLPITVCMTALEHPIKEIPIKKNFMLASQIVPSYHNALDRMISDLNKYRRENYRVVLLTPSRTRAERIAQSLREYQFIAKIAKQDDEVVECGEILVAHGNLHKGFAYLQCKFVVLSESDLFGGQKRKRGKQKTGHQGSKISSLSELSIGDYVVHEDHGLGIYRGIEKIERDHIIRDYIKIEYAGKDSCYIPATKLDLIQKFAGAQAKVPKLNKLGGGEWEKTKKRVKAAVENIAKELVMLYAARESGRGHLYAKDSQWQKEFEEMFPFEETTDQKNAIADIKNDMEAGKIMDRLVCGDVGYGKTEVALRAAFKAIQEGKQVIYLVPTTILAQQHYHTFVQRMKEFPVRVDLLCRFNTVTEQKKTIQDFKDGWVDIIVGTHKVLSKALVAKDLGLIIIDEEQRFGVKHKEKLKQLRENVNVLTLTATPIPRTLHMSLVGIRDLSVLEEPPIDRQPIQTYVMEQHDEIIKEAIRRELARRGQVYYVYNRVNNIAEVSAHVQSLVPDATVAYAHGQMAERELEKIMLEFINGEIDVLVSTTIIETGLDIPNANTMIIQDADHLGLSQLYQLRGRVGRSSRTSYAFLLYRRGKLLNAEAQKRLKAIREFTELGSGIKIAMRDLEIRGAGNVLGAEQHGHMQAVGYELYCKLLGVAVRALKGEEVEKEEFETSVDVDISAYIPSSYIKNEEQKLDVYKRIASIETLDDYLDMQDELLDRFGEMNSAVDNLLTVARVKSLAHNVYITEIKIEKQEVHMQFYPKAKVNLEKLPELLEAFSPELSIRHGEEVELIYRQRKKQTDCTNSLEKTLEIVERMNTLLLKVQNSLTKESKKDIN